MKKYLSIVLTGALTAWAGAAEAQTKWQMPTPYAPGEFHTVNIRQFADDVKAGSGGKLEIVVHPAGSLMPLPQIKRAIQTGEVQIGEILLSALENEDPMFGVDTVPFVVTGYDASQQLMAKAKPALAERLKRQGIRLLYATPWPPQGFYADKPINSVADMKGLKFRSYGPSAARFGELVGAAVSTIQAAELGEALNTGRVNSMITSGATGSSAKVWETNVKYFYQLDAWLPHNGVIISEQAFMALDEGTRNAILKAAAAAETRGLELSKKRASDAVALLKQNGMQVQGPSAQLAADLKKVGATMASEWEAKAGADGAALLAPFKK
ncbi:MAG: TRAP transporter substrate-binding protein [Rhodospirillales bacterium]|nr:TRAP transporter substrate-binding protein [Rhodospirillales bacterium]